MPKCNKCKSVEVSITKDGALGIRSHCLKCGYTVPVKEPKQPKKG